MLEDDSVEPTAALVDGVEALSEPADVLAERQTESEAHGNRAAPRDEPLDRPVDEAGRIADDQLPAIG